MPTLAGRTDEELLALTALDLRIDDDNQISATDDDLARLAKLGMPLLERLDIDGSHITDAGLAHIAQLTSLKMLFSMCSSITEVGICHLAKLPNLSQIILQRAPGITGENFAQLTALPVQQLHLAESGITDQGLACIVATFPDLEVINIASTNVSDDGLAALANLNKAGRLHVGNPNTSDKGILHLLKLKTAPRIIMIPRMCEHISLDATDQLTRQFPRCRIG